MGAEVRGSNGGSGRRGGFKAGHALIAALMVAAPVSSALASPPAQAARESKAEVRSIRGLSQILFHPRPSPTSTRRDTQRVRDRLAELRRTLVEVEGDPTPARIERLRNRKFDAVQACKRLRSAFEVEMKSLWQDVDYALVDPVGQRVRLQTARQRIDDALAQPSDLHGPSMTLLLDLAPGR